MMVPPDDPVALAAALRGALDRQWDPELLRRSVEFLSWDAVGRRYRDLMEEARERRDHAEDRVGGLR
jgi:glycosyltransferase involved in cell wall biosynthesis